MLVNKTNLEIYTLYKKLQEAFLNENRNFPVKVFFYIQKNINVLQIKVEEIEKTREYIIKKYGTINYENNNYNISSEYIQQANEELQQLENIKQDIELKTINFSDIENLELTPAQMDSLMFMIEE